MKQLNKVIKQLKAHPFGDAYLLTALYYYNNEVLTDSSDWGNSVFSKEAWQDLAKAVQSTINN